MAPHVQEICTIDAASASGVTFTLRSCPSMRRRTESGSSITAGLKRIHRRASDEPQFADGPRLARDCPVHGVAAASVGSDMAHSVCEGYLCGLADRRFGLDADLDRLWQP